MPSAYAHVLPDGFGHGKHSRWRDSETDDKFRSVTFTNIPQGSYVVRNVLTWESDGHVHREVSPSWCES